MVGKASILGTILTTEISNPMKLIGDRYFVQVEDSHTMKVDRYGNIFTKNSPEELQAFIDKETTRANARLAELEQKLSESKDDFFVRNLEIAIHDLKKYIHTLPEYDKVPYFPAKNIITFSFEGELDDAKEASIKEGVNNLIVATGSTNSVLLVELEVTKKTTGAIAF